MSAFDTFGLILRQPGPRISGEFGNDEAPVYLAPDFTTPVEWWKTAASGDPRVGDDIETDWALSLPHQCGEWGIWDGTREQVLAAARRFQSELAGAIAVLESPFALLLERMHGADLESLAALSAAIFEAHQDGRLTAGQFNDLDAAWNARRAALEAADV